MLIGMPVPPWLVLSNMQYAIHFSGQPFHFESLAFRNNTAKWYHIFLLPSYLLSTNFFYKIYFQFTIQSFTTHYNSHGTPLILTTDIVYIRLHDSTRMPNNPEYTVYIHNTVMRTCNECVCIDFSIPMSLSKLAVHERYGPNNFGFNLMEKKALHTQYIWILYCTV